MGSLEQRLNRIEHALIPTSRHGTLADLVLCARGGHGHPDNAEWCERFTWSWLPDLVEQST